MPKLRALTVRTNADETEGNVQEVVDFHGFTNTETSEPTRDEFRKLVSRLAPYMVPWGDEPGWWKLEGAQPNKQGHLFVLSLEDDQ